MRTIVIFKDDSEQARAVLDFLREFEHRTGRQLEVMDPDSREGAGFCATYDIVEYPTMIALDDGGQLQQMWRGPPLPTISEVSYYS